MSDEDTDRLSSLQSTSQAELKKEAIKTSPLSYEEDIKAKTANDDYNISRHLKRLKIASVYFLGFLLALAALTIFLAGVYVFYTYITDISKTPSEVKKLLSDLFYFSLTVAATLFINHVVTKKK